MRRDFDRRPQRIKAVLTEDGLRKEFLKGAPKNDAKAVKAFVAAPSNAESALKTKPKVRYFSFRGVTHSVGGCWRRRLTDSLPGSECASLSLWSWS